MNSRSMGICLSLFLLACGREDGASSGAAPTSAQVAQATKEEAAEKAPVTEAPPPPIKDCTVAPTLAHIPEGPVLGAIDGKTFLARALVFEQGLKGWVLRVHDTALADPVGLSVGGQHIEIRLPREPSTSWQEVRPMGLGDGYWTAEQSQNTATRMGAEAWALEVTRWQVRPWMDEAGVIQDAGRATGRLAVVLQGDGGRCAWVAGRFDNAIVRYVGRPRLDAAQRALGMAAPVPSADVGSLPVDQQQIRREKALYERKNLILKSREAQGY